jgi:hypothetical protein
MIHSSNEFKIFYDLVLLIEVKSTYGFYAKEQKTNFNLISPN